MIKPSAVVRGLIGRIIDRIEIKGFRIICMKMLWMNKKNAELLYSAHKGKVFYAQLIKRITSAPVVVMVLESANAISVMRRLIGSTDPVAAQPGTIRGDMALSLDQNIIHASDSVENAKREIAIFFASKELLAYQRADELWV